MVLKDKKTVWLEWEVHYDESSLESIDLDDYSRRLADSRESGNEKLIDEFVKFC